MYKQIPLVITASILLTAFLTIALYTGSEAHAQAGGNMTGAGANMTGAGANMTGAGGNMTGAGGNMTGAGGNMTSSNATAAGGANMTQPLVPPKMRS